MPPQEYGLLALEIEFEDLVGFGIRQQVVAGLLREGLKILYRAGVGGHNAQYLAGGHFGKCFLGTQDRQRTAQPLDIKLTIKLHDQFQNEYKNAF